MKGEEVAEQTRKNTVEEAKLQKEAEDLKRQQAKQVTPDPIINQRLEQIQQKDTQIVAAGKSASRYKP